MSEIQPLTDAEVEEECAYVEELAHDAIKRNEDQHRLARVSLNASRLLNLLARIRADGKRIEKMQWLLCHIQQWDMLDTTADGNYWKQQIQAALEDKTK